jgi:8-oxo-dGTP pyrophosphatase MutT (NUDIX family)
MADGGFRPMAKSKSRTRRSMRRYQQYAALPVRMEAGHLQVLLLTSRGTGRWVIPKGWPMCRLRPAAAAAMEAYEEAGLEGTIADETPIGHYHYDKALPGGRTVGVLVDVFLLRVSRQLAAWPEQAERERRWYDPDAAAGLVAEPELAAILRGVAAKAGRPGVTDPACFEY